MNPVATPCDNPTPSLQESLETEMLSEGISKYRRDVQEMKEKGSESETPYGIKLMRLAIEPLAKRIQEFIDDAESGRPGRRHIAYRYLKQFDADVSAYIISRTVLSSISQPTPLTEMATKVASNLEDEARFQVFRKADKRNYANTLRDLNRRTTHDRHRKAVLRYAMSRHDIGWEAWPQSDCIHLGRQCVDLFVQSTGFVDTIRQKVGKNKTANFIVATQATMDAIRDKNARCELFQPVLRPMVVPPVDWTTPTNGGYLTEHLSMPLVKTRNNHYLEELRNTDMPEVYDSINALQQTPFRIKEPVLEVMQHLWDIGSDLGNLPPQEPRPLPLCPVCHQSVESDKGKHACFADGENNKNAHWKWKRMAAEVYSLRTRDSSHCVQTFAIMEMARRYSKYPAFYFPYQLDFRSRVYAVPRYLNPQGPDTAKGLIEFANGKPLGSKMSVFWLAAHGANCWGYDKVSLEDRVRWTQANSDAIMAVASDPYENKWWADADGGEKAWQFLSFCFEWAGYLTDGLDFVTRLPVSIDGSCNGLQHFSALLRDEVGGKAVNLMPSDEPADIYQSVADEATAILCAHRDASVTDSDYDGDPKLAAQWLEFGVDRKITKRPVMIVPYGGSPFAIRRYVLDEIKEQIESGKAENVFGESDLFPAACYLSNVIWQAIGNVVIAARSAMDWLQEAAEAAADEGLPITWSTPADFPVLQAYPETQSRTIKTKAGDQFIKMTLREDTDRIDKRKQAQGVSPNFVHSLDAAALQMTVNEARRRGIESFVMVHDSYGTLATDIEELGDVTREVFVDLYENHDVLAEFREDVLPIIDDSEKSLPPIPPKGDLNIREVLDSDFFFA